LLGLRHGASEVCGGYDRVRSAIFPELLAAAEFVVR
jgi:hypothetical protein